MVLYPLNEIRYPRRVGTRISLFISIKLLKERNLPTLQDLNSFQTKNFSDGGKGTGPSDSRFIPFLKNNNFLDFWLPFYGGL
jgi:hypothetical protein